MDKCLSQKFYNHKKEKLKRIKLGVIKKLNLYLEWELRLMKEHPCLMFL